MRTIVFDGIQAISSSLNELEEDEGTASDREMELLELRSEISMAQRKLREESARLETLLIKHIDRNGDIQIGDGQRLYVGNTKVTKSLDDKQVFLMVLDAAGGDLGVFQKGSEGVFVSQPWKIGAVRKMVGEELFYSAFAVETVKDLKTGAAKRSVKEFDDAFS